MSNRKRKSTEQPKLVTSQVEAAWKEQRRTFPDAWNLRRRVAAEVRRQGAAAIHVLLDRRDADVESLTKELAAAMRWVPGGIYNGANKPVEPEQLIALGNRMINSKVYAHAVSLPGGGSVEIKVRTDAQAKEDADARAREAKMIEDFREEARAQNRRANAIEKAHDEAYAMLRRAVAVIKSLDRARGEVTRLLDDYAQI